MAVRMELSRVLIMESSPEHIVELREVGGERVFPIMVGLNEAAAIERRLLGQAPSRPQTHELLASVIETLGGSLQKILISELRYHEDIQRAIFHARLFIQQNGQLHEIDARPSDALALGAAHDVPIFVNESVLTEVWREE